MNVTRLRGLIAEKRLSQAEVARRIGITPSAFYMKMARGDFWVTEAAQLIQILDIEDPIDIFFSHGVT